MIVDGLMFFVCGSVGVVGFARGRRVEEVSKAGRTICGVFVTWAWHFHPDVHSESNIFKNMQCLRRKRAR